MKWILVLVTALLPICPAAHAASVPSTGCVTDGQVGPVPAPASATRQVDVDDAAAAGLGWFFQSSMGVLAPRGWYCLALTGSSGTSLYVTPRPLSAAEMLRPGFGGIQGPAIQLSVSVGDTSGRFVAAKRIAQLFPHERKFVDAVIAENIVPASAFPSGPYPHDALIRRNANVFEYETRPDAPGLGYDSWLAPGDRPISGVVILLKEHNVLTLAMRLPREPGNAGRLITRQVQVDNPPMRVVDAPRVVTGDAAAKLFVYNNRPIHPFCVDFPADSARWHAIVLPACSDTPVLPTAGAGGWLQADYPRDDRPRGYSSYIVLASKGDRFLLGISTSGGGSGHFSHLDWVSLVQDQLRLSTHETGGDRCVGGVSDFEVKGGAIQFDQVLPSSEIIALSRVAVEQFITAELNGAPPDCDGLARYRYDPVAEKMQLLSVQINTPEAPAAAATDPQSCFNRLARQLGRSNVLKPADLDRFVKGFLKACR